MTRLKTGWCAALSALVFLAGTSPVQAQTQSLTGAKLKACFIYVGPIGDYGWTYAHNQGKLATEKALPWLETRYVESVPENAVTPVIDRLVADKCQVIFTTSYGYMDATVAAGKKYPNVIFAHATGYKRGPNVMTYLADFTDVYYLNGLVAGVLSKSGVGGYVAAFPTPEVKRHIGAFALGMREVNPKASLRVNWINAWFGPDKATEATNSLQNQGADVFAFTEDTPATIQAAAKSNLPAFGHYSSMAKASPGTIPSGQIAYWDKIYIDFLTKVHTGAYTTKNLSNVNYWWNMRQGAAAMAYDYGVPINPKFIPALKAKMVKDRLSGKTMSAYDLVLSRAASITAGKFAAFTGPIQDRKGTLRVPAGKVLSNAELETLSWAAPGILGDWADEPK